MKKFFAKFLTILLTMTIFLSVGECREFVFVVNFKSDNERRRSAEKNF